MNRSVHEPGDSLFLQVTVESVYQDLDEDREVIHFYTVVYENIYGTKHVLNDIPEYDLNFIF